MAAADRYREVQDDRAADFSNESDDSSERARLLDPTSEICKLIISHGIKRGGNNHFGSTGILKCLTCRKRKGKVNPPSPMFVYICINFWNQV